MTHDTALEFGFITQDCCSRLRQSMRNSMEMNDYPLLTDLDGMNEPSLIDIVLQSLRTVGGRGNANAINKEFQPAP